MPETERLIIRPFREDDARKLYENHLDDEVRKWFPNECYADPAEALDAIRFYTDCVNGGHLPFVLGVELKETGELIGDTGVSEVEGKPDETEIGYCIGKPYRGKGYASELLNAMSGYSAARFGTRVIYGRVVRGNTASAKVLEKSGYRFVREEFGAEDDPYGNGMLVYGKSQEGKNMFRPMRRSNQQISEAECIRILQEEKRGILSMHGEDGYPYGIPMNHWYNAADGKLYFHGARTGHKLDAVAKDNRVSYCVHDAGYTKEGEWALNIKSVVVFGRISLVTDEEKAREICAGLCRKFTDDEEYIEKELTNALPRVQCLELSIDHMTGKLVNES